MGGNCMLLHCGNAEGDVIGGLGAAGALVVGERDQAHKGHRPAQEPHPGVLVHHCLQHTPVLS